MFINEEDMLVSFGQYKGMKIRELPGDYKNWMIKNVKNKEESKAILRIMQRRGITSLIKREISYTYIPILTENKSIPKITRPEFLNSSLFGVFIETLVKFHLKINIANDTMTLIDTYKGVEQKCIPELLKRIFQAYDKSEKSVSDICVISFSTSIILNNHLKPIDFERLRSYVEKNEPYFESWLLKLEIEKPNIPQNTCCDISIGALTGVIDMITKDTIVDIKCCKEDDVDYYSKQLFSYACMHYLRHGYKFKGCEIYNFVTGKSFYMELGNSVEKYAIEHVKKLGSFSSSHRQIFDK